MRPDVAVIWRRTPADWDVRLNESLRSGCDKAGSDRPVTIFFRADDVAAPGDNFKRMMALFARHGVPLSLAVVPAWLTPARWLYLKGFEKSNPSRWCWHQHGWRHANHEVSGKKQEFGDARTAVEITQDLTRGKLRLEQIMAEAFFPVFTPPWNRCSASALQALKKLGYAAVSRSRGSKPVSTGGLPDYYVNVDLHTRKEQDSVSGWHNLLGEFEQALASGLSGVMIHHQMMNDAAFDFLEVLLKALTSYPDVHLVHFKDMIGQRI